MVMNDFDYDELGLKVGFEIHQELDTHKLFCECPSELRDDDPEMTVNRELRPTESELGEIDRAALAEEAKSKKFQYGFHPDGMCLVELDEEPPHSVSEKAMDIGLEAALLFDATPVDEAHVMRKTVIDGSNTAGFQRTILLATDGEMEVGEINSSLPTLCLEEDAARKIGESSDRVKYNLDRLGIPLLEIATAPDFNDPETAQEAAEKMGKILRATGKMKRGIGTIRQDVNVSIERGARQEIKGVQELSLISPVIEREVLRQVRLLEIKDDLIDRGIPEVESDIEDVTDVFSDTDSGVIKSVLPEGKVLAIKLEGFDGLLGKEVQPDRRFGTELLGYAKVYGGVEGIFHTDELPDYGITEEEVEKVKDQLGAGGSDAVVMIADEENKAKKGIEAVADRANMAFEGIPEETRRALSEGNTQYMRPLPGAARMYVETDVPPIQITEERLGRIREILPEKPSEKEGRYKEDFDLSEELANQMSVSENADLFEDIVEEFDTDPTLVASTLEQHLAQIENEGLDTSGITDDSLKEIFSLVSKNEISKDALSEILKAVGSGSEVQEAVEELGVRKMGSGEVERIVEETVEDKRDLIDERGKKSIDALMGLVMKGVGGKADGQTVHKLLEEKVEEIVS